MKKFILTFIVVSSSLIGLNSHARVASGNTLLPKKPTVGSGYVVTCAIPGHCTAVESCTGNMQCSSGQTSQPTGNGGCEACAL